MYQLKLEQFSGPINKLLELIEEKKMDVTDLNLADITADFLKYLENLKIQTDADGKIQTDINTRILADFIVVASQLLLIKSKTLLPGLQLTGEEEKEIKDLEGRLKLYQQIKPLITYIKELSEQKNISVSRPLFAGRLAIFYPSPDIKVNVLYQAMKSIFEEIRQLSNEIQTISFSAITLEEKVQEIMERLKSNLEFGTLIKEKPKAEIIVMFLALLHLLIKEHVSVKQDGGFSEIVITRQEV
jgi:segregation and condensation protein A